MKQWEQYAGKMSQYMGERVPLPSMDQVLVATELVLDNQGKLREVNRVAGENEVRNKGDVVSLPMDSLQLVL